MCNESCPFTHFGTGAVIEFELEPEEVKKDLHLLLTVENLLVLINDILDFNKIEAGQIEFEKVGFSLHELVNNIRFALLQKAEEKGIQRAIKECYKISVAFLTDNLF